MIPKDEERAKEREGEMNRRLAILPGSARGFINKDKCSMRGTSGGRERGLDIISSERCKWT